METGEQACAHGCGVAVLTTIAQIFSDYMRKHPAYACVSGVLAILMVLAPVVHTVHLWFRKLYGSEPAPPLEIIFEPLNPARRFWSLESHRDDYKRHIGNF